jgi:hypothetical protein
MCLFPGGPHDTSQLLMGLEGALQLNEGLVLCCHLVEAEAATVVGIALSIRIAVRAC